MPDKVAQYILSLAGDDTDLNALFAGVKSRFRSNVAELKKIGENIDLFGDLKNTLPGVERALDSAKQRVAQFAAEIDKLKGQGKPPTQDLVDGLAQAERAVKSASAEFSRQQQQLTSLGNQLSRAGVDTKNLAAEQQRLAVASKAAADAAAVMAAKQSLGLVTVKDTSVAAQKLQADFDLLKLKGGLSATETAAAQRLLTAELKALSATVNTTGSAFVGFARDAKQSYADVALKITGTVAALAAVGHALASVTEAAKAYNNELAKVGTVTTLGQTQLASLGIDARKLAEELGIGVVDALKSLFEIIRSGVPADNAIEVLRAGALAAKAAITDTATGAKASTVLIDAFGIEVKDLSGALDIVVKSAQTGGPTLTEFAANAGLLGNAARATGADFKEVAALLNVMTDASNDAAGSTALLAKILINLDKPETQAGLRKLGLDGKSLVETFQGLDARGLRISEFLELGVVNTKAAVALTALTNNANKLPGALNSVATAAGTVATATAKLYDTPEERKKRFDAALEETKIKLGQLAGASGQADRALTLLLTRFNDGAENYLKFKKAQDEQAIAIDNATLKLLGFGPAADSAATAIKSFRESSIPLASELDKNAAATKRAADSLTAYSKTLAESIVALNKAGADQIATLNERAALEISLLDKSTAAQQATAAKTLEIQAKLNADILVVLINNAEKVRVAVEAGEKIITDERTKAGKKEVEIAQEVAKLRAAALEPVVAAYQKHYATLATQAQAFQATINKIEAEQLSIKESSEQKIRTARVAGLTDLQQYAEKSAEVDRLIAKGRETAATQGFEAAKKYFEQADRISETIKGEVVSDGLVVITEFQSQQKSIDLLKRSADAYNQALADDKDKAKEGADKTKTALADTAELIKGIQKQLDDAKKTLSEGISIKINEDIDGLEAARKKIDDLVKAREVLIRVRTEDQGAPGETPSGFNQGGAVQHFAGGGSVFRVPGTGNSDTVPARLPVGSFVMRKAAVQQYGEGAFARVARGYASGGTVAGEVTGALDTLGNLPDISPAPSASDAITYARFIDSFLRTNGIQQRMKDQIERYANQLARDPSAEWLIQALIRTARNAASTNSLENLLLQNAQGVGGGAIGGGTFAAFKNLPDWFDLYGEQGKPKPGNPLHHGIDFRTIKHGFATGGSVDTVPAMLTPGEVVLNPAAVQSAIRNFGGGFLDAMNAGRLPRSFIPPPMPRHYAMGGPVGNVPGWKQTSASGGGVTFGDIHIHTTEPIDSPRSIDKVLSAIDNRVRRAGQSLSRK